MKFQPLIAVYVIAELLVSSSALKKGVRDPDYGDAFRSDTTLRFMRKIHEQSREEVQDGLHQGMEGAQTPIEDAQKAEDKFNKHMDKLTGTKSAAQPTKKDTKEANKSKKGEGHRQLRKKGQAEKEEAASVPGCENVPGWMDAKDKDCQDYAEGEFCTRHGGYGDAWLDEWGTFEDVSVKGKSAKEACCVCGGGDREGEEAAEAPEPAKGGSAPAAPGGSAPAAGPSPAAAVLESKEGRPLQEQGFAGELVEHEDENTMTEDWGREFGPRAGHRDIKTICKEHPDNEWCSLHGYHDRHIRSAAFSSKLAGAFFLTLFLACRP